MSYNCDTPSKLNIIECSIACVHVSGVVRRGARPKKETSSNVRHRNHLIIVINRLPKLNIIECSIAGVHVSGVVRRGESPRKKS